MYPMLSSWSLTSLNVLTKKLLLLISDIVKGSPSYFFNIVYKLFSLFSFKVEEEKLFVAFFSSIDSSITTSDLEKTFWSKSKMFVSPINSRWSHRTEHDLNSEIKIL